jgi:arylsulfatase A-like enzyme
MPKPNILFILTDQHWAGSLGCYGNTICRTPVIDSLAQKGLRFDNAYCATPICSPARASLQTGLMPSRHGMQTNIYTRGCMVHELPDHPSLLPRRLQHLGYHTGYTGKWHMGFGDAKADHPEYQHHIRSTPGIGRVDLKGSLPSSLGYDGDDFPGHGGVGTTTPQYLKYLQDHRIDLKIRKVFDYYPDTFEVLSGPESTVSYMLTSNAMRHIDAFEQRGGPWFYMLNFWGPHSPYHASSPFLDLYRHVEIPEWPSFREDLRAKPAIHNAHRTETTAKWRWSEFQEIIRFYYASITEIDANIGRLLEHLQSHGVLDNTLVIFSADHGDALGIHRGLTDKSLFMYEQTNRVPLIISTPDQRRAGDVEERFVGTCDLYSTILESAGLSRGEAQLDGKSLVPLLNDESVIWRDSIVTESAGLDFLQASQRAIRWRHFKYVFNVGEVDELYDLKADPHEMINLVEDPRHRNLLAEGRKKLDAWMQAQGDGLVERYRRMRGLVPRIDLA